MYTLGTVPNLLLEKLFLMGSFSVLVRTGGKREGVIIGEELNPDVWGLPCPLTDV